MAESDEQRPWTYVSVQAQVHPCLNCAEPLVMFNGQFQCPVGGRLALWNYNGQPAITAHRAGCRHAA